MKSCAKVVKKILVIAQRRRDSALLGVHGTFVLQHYLSRKNANAGIARLNSFQILGESSYIVRTRACISII